MTKYSPALHEIPGPTGVLEALLELPSGDPRAVVVLAHPLSTHGGTMHTKMLFQAAKGLVRAGCAVLRFNFRGVGRSPGSFDQGRGEQDDFRAAVDYAASRFSGLEIWGGGGSFGAFVGMVASTADPRVMARIGIATPVNHHDFSAVLATPKPTFLVHGEEDELISVGLVREFYARLEEPKEMVVIDRANHLFEGQAGEVGDALEDLLDDFLVADKVARPSHA
jgi:alpha/beta superfamily hydrolase